MQNLVIYPFQKPLSLKLLSILRTILMINIVYNFRIYLRVIKTKLSETYNTHFLMYTSNVCFELV